MDYTLVITSNASALVGQSTACEPKAAFLIFAFLPPPSQRLDWHVELLALLLFPHLSIAWY